MAGKGNRVRIARLIILAFAAVGCVALFAVAKIYFAETPRVDPGMSASDAIAQVSQLDKEEVYPLDPVLEMARDALANMHLNVRDYTATLEKQEFVAGELSGVTRIELKILHAPLEKPATVADAAPEEAAPEQVAAPFRLHAYFHFLEPPSAAGREVIYVEGANDGNLIVHEGGFKNFFRLKLDPEGDIAMLGNKYPANRVGLEMLLRKLIEKGLRDRKVPGTSVEIEESFIWEGVSTRRITVTHPEPREGLDFHKAVIIIDPQRQVPLAFSSYLWPTEPGGEPPLEESYAYHDLKLNVGLTAEDFNPDNEAYNFP